MLVNDIEKMKAEFAAKLDLAEKENAINKGIEGYILHLSSYGKRRPNGCFFSICMRVPYEPLVGFREPTITQVAEVLNKFPQTKDTIYDKEFNLPYVIHSSRGYGDRYGQLSIDWISDNYEVRATMEITEPLMEFFITKLRHVTDSECSTYTSIHINKAYERPCVPEYNFKKEHKKYHGGVRLLTDREEILRIIDFIKNYKA